MKAQWEDEVLKEREYQGKDLKTENLSEDKRSHGLKTDLLCISQVKHMGKTIF